jgi:hypothetical protein
MVSQYFGRRFFQILSNLLSESRPSRSYRGRVKAPLVYRERLYAFISFQRRALFLIKIARRTDFSIF